MNLSGYKTLVFDCDGVILNSNKIKTEAFRHAALPYGEAAAGQLVEYHLARGGVSRYKKFKWFLESVVSGRAGPNCEELLIRYAEKARSGLISCEIANGLSNLRDKTASAKWMIVSGGDQKELQEVFAERGLDSLFDGGIFGSPDSKDVILKRELEKGNIKRPALFLGDSRYDHVAANAASLDFLFLSGWSEFEAWAEYCFENQIKFVESISSLT